MISGGLLPTSFRVDEGAVVDIFGSSFLLNNQPIAGLKQLGDSLVLTARGGQTLKAILADGSLLQWQLTSPLSPRTPFGFSAQAILRLHLVPEPTAALLFGQVLGLVLLWTRRREKMEQSRQRSFSTPAPVTWAYGACSMNRSKLRRQIAWEAARLMYSRQESEYYTAKMKAAQQICQGWVKPADLPSNAEIRDQIQMLARLHEGARRTDNLLDMRLAALAMMRRLAPFRPRLIGSVLTGHVRQGSDIDLHVFSDTAEAVTHLLDQDGLDYDVERKQVRKHGEERIFTHIHLVDGFPFELTIYAADQAHYVFKSSITGKAIERASIAELEQFLDARVSGPRSGRRGRRGREPGRPLPGLSSRCCCRWKT